MSSYCNDCGNVMCLCDDIKQESVLTLDGKKYVLNWNAPIDWGKLEPRELILTPEQAVIQEPWQVEIERLEKEIKALRLILTSHGLICEENAKLRKMVIALDNGISITSDGLTYFKGSFSNEQ